MLLSPCAALDILVHMTHRAYQKALCVQANVLPQNFTNCMSVWHSVNVIDDTVIWQFLAVVSCHNTRSDKGTRPLVRLWKARPMIGYDGNRPKNASQA